ncbi:MAG TPA: AAA family ATPase [Candidatus Kapabacteria bacterium]|nr:AAA family ATPase [Candidatus Kapabacteria bacterium]HPO62413.1 AAA family ATPase [Candidatus Kapabacteria bacterium]
MENFIKNLEIENYKSIKRIELECSRINIFIGKPNVGKSNILEVLSLLGNHSGNAFYSDYINYERITELFHDFDDNNDISVRSNLCFSKLKLFKSDSRFAFFLDWSEANEEYVNKVFNYNNIYEFKKWFFDEYLKLQEFKKEHCTFFDFNAFGIDLQKSIIKSNLFSYSFKKNNNFEVNNRLEQYLIPPFGENLFYIFSIYNELKEEFAYFLKEYGLEPVYDKLENKMSFQKKEGSTVYTFHYSLLADTLQRIMFYKAAIYSHQNSILVFEEPEVNSFPPYIKDLAQTIINSEENQFFISTHSPYLFTSMLEDDSDAVSIFLTDYKNHQTVIKKLTKEQKIELMKYGIDILLNIESYS